jgi:hypothetical protein
MSTAWYIADEDGNVGIVDFNDNGPVPWGLGEHFLDELVIGPQRNGRLADLTVKLTDVQLSEILGQPCKDDEIDWSNCIVQIDPKRTYEFLSLIKNDKSFIQRCISKERGIYKILPDFVDYTYDNKVKPRSKLAKIIKRGIIQCVYARLDIFVRDKCTDEKVEFTKTFDTLPYYVYAEPYDRCELAELLVEPVNPVKVDQLPKLLRKKLIQLPIKFKDTPKMQIAQWTPCDVGRYWCWNGASEIAYGCLYTLLPNVDGGQSYYVIDPLSYTDEQPNELAKALREVKKQLFCQYPTVLALHGPAWKSKYHLNCDYSDIVLHSIHTQYLPFNLVDDTMSWPSEAKMRWALKKHSVKDIFKAHSCVMEYIVDRFKPQLILIDDADIETISSVYPIANHEITVQGYQYPIYTHSEIYTNKKHLTELALRPYRGVQYPLVMSVEEMRKINPELKGLKDDD